MIGERLSGWSPARERGHGGGRGRSFGGGDFGGEFVLGRGRFEVFKRQLELVQQTRGALRAWAKTIAVELFDLQLQMRDQRLIVGLPGANDGQFGARRKQRRVQRFNVVRQFFKAVSHVAIESQNPRFGVGFLQP